MQSGIFRLAALGAALCVTLAGCGSMKVWPFGEKEATELPGQPPNSTAYECEGGKRFYVRMLEQGNVAWLILPLREVGLAKTESASGVRYSNGISTLHLKGDEATLEENADNVYQACRVITAQTLAEKSAAKPEAKPSKPEQTEPEKVEPKQVEPEQTESGAE